MIYPPSSIKRAMKDYAPHASFTCRESRQACHVTMRNIDQDVKDHFADEFGNYVLGLSKKCL